MSPRHLVFQSACNEKIQPILRISISHIKIKQEEKACDFKFFTKQMIRLKFLLVIHTILDHHVMGGGFSLDSEKSSFSKAYYFDIYFFHGFFLATFLYTG